MKRFTSTPLRDWLVGSRSDIPDGESSSAARRRRLSRSIAGTSNRRAAQRRIQLEKLESRQLLAVVSGEVFLDVNQDGLRQDDEVAAADVRVYIDQNTNGKLDAAELSTNTDVDGFYSFPTLNAGDYQVRVDPAAGFVQTAPSVTFGWDDTVVQDENGDYFRAAQLFQVDAQGEVESIGQPTSRRMDGLVQIGDNSLLGIDTRANEVFRVDPYTGERFRISESNLDIVGGLAYDRVGNAVYTLVRGSSEATNRTLARIDTNTASATLIGDGYSGLSSVSDLAFDPVNRRVIGFDNSDDEFFAFDLNGIGGTLARASFTGIDASSMALATAEQLEGVLPGGPTSTSTYVWMFDADDNDRTSTLLVEIPDALPNIVETAIVRASIDVSEAVRPVALTRSAIGNNARDITVTQFESRNGVNFAVAPDVIGFRLLPSRPLTGAGSLGQVGATVVGGAIEEDFVEVSLNRQPDSDVTLNLSRSSGLGGDPGVVLDVNQLTFTPDDWATPRRVRLTPDPAHEVQVITPSTLTATVDAASSDPQFANLPAQTLPVRALPALDADKFDTPVISEILIDGRFTSAVTNTTDQYIELRGKPNEVLPAGTYFVVIEEWSTNTGDISTVIDLSGQSFGENGFLVLLQGANSYDASFGANVLQSDLTGFNGLPGGIFSSAQSNGSLDTPLDDASYFLIQSDTPPAVDDDIDANDDGFIDADSPAADWTTFDAVAMHGYTFNQASFAPIVFVENATNYQPVVERNSRGQTIVSIDGFGYVGRIGDSIGSDYEDWVGGTVDDVGPGFWGGEADEEGLFEFHENELTFPALNDHALDHIGESNFVGGVRGRISLLPSNGDIENGTPPDTTLPAEGVTVFVDTNGNGTRDDLLHVVEPDDAAPPFDINNPLPNDAEYPLTQEYDGVTISWARADGAIVTDDIVSRRQQIGFRTVGNRIFSAGPFDEFYSSNRLRFDFFRPISSASIDVFNSNSRGFVYGRLDAYNAAGELVATSLSSAVSGSQRGRITVSAPGEQIVRVEAYGDDSFNADSFNVSFDSFSYLQPEPVAITDQNGIYEIGGLFPGNYELAVAGTAEVANLLATSTTPFRITKYENFFFDSEFRPNTAPTFPEGTNIVFNLDENPPAGSVIGTIDAYDADNSGLTYEFVAGNSTGLELVVLPDFTAEIRTTADADLDFEAEPERILTVRVSDELGASESARVTLQLNDINEAPVISDAELSVPEGAVAGATTGTVIGRIDAVDPDADSDQQLTYDVIPSTDEDFFENDGSPYFSVDQLTGVVRLTAPLDFEAISSLVLRVRVSDNNSAEGQTPGVAIADKIIRVSDENDPPQVATTSFDVPESATGELANLEAMDPDDGQNHTFQLVNPSSLLHVTAAGQVVLNPGQALDFETAPEIRFDVSVSDNGSPPLATTSTIVLNVQDVNEPAVLNRNSNQNSPASENQPGLLIATLALVDPEGLNSDYAYELLPGPDSDLFQFDPLSGRLQLADGVTLDYEAAPHHDLSFEIVDRTGQLPTTTQPFRVYVNDVNEPAYVTTNKIFVSEVPSPGDEIGRIGVVDPDPNIAGSSLSIEIIGGTAQQFFEFESAANSPGKPVADIDPFLLKVRGDFDLADFRAIDPEDLDLQVRVSDGNSSTVQPIDVQIELNEVNEPPVFNDAILARTFDGEHIVTGTTYRLTIPQDIASDPEDGDFLLRIGQKVRDQNGDVVLDEGGRVKLSLPDWLTFNPDTLELVGRPGRDVHGDIDLVIRALEVGPFPLSVDHEFVLPVAPLQNLADAYDVNNDDAVTSLDALRIINFLNESRTTVATAGSLSDDLVYLDVSGDGFVTELDALQVINELNRLGGVEQEPAGEPTTDPVGASGLDHITVPVDDAFASREDHATREESIDAVFGQSNLF
ncbi:cadherin domain-containing protein [Allorhodopirellula solitaria]|uniref:Cadherin domain protein n=1 Tax=Allorhodopirellula solitaria TaxID=2527987 RepID=A0A5C5XS01_9BACT|nr:cadherin domain-containing protein [Allorhodopirellula solitaria]TWT65301.1 Cadherin domain protein [Allorhodopirellula solitaria]